MCLSQAMVEQECVGAIVCKLDMHKKMFRRGYIAMLAVDSKHRRKSIGEIWTLGVTKRINMKVCSFTMWSRDRVVQQRFFFMHTLATKSLNANAVFR